MNSLFSLRPLKIEDAPRMLEWLQNDSITHYMNIGGSDSSLETVYSFIESTKDESSTLHRAIVDSNDRYLGTVSLKNIDTIRREAEYAIAMHPDGIGCSASKVGSELILNYAFNTLGLTRVYLYVRKDNTRAIKFYRKLEILGMKQFSPKPAPNNDTASDVLWFEIYA